ncbi:type II toxin-antitoxin system VapC family toxin [Streptomyces californicus]|uniref:type II toxin-antitoxin system VapC family toxin n=1 Tax=Streptomyces californicus TaxID=67351 RepID=UPI0035D59FC6
MGKADAVRPVYLDANCFIDWAQGAETALAVQSWIQAAAQGKVQLLTSTLTLAEARGDGRALDVEERRQRIRKVLLDPCINLVEVTRRVGLIANDITVDRPRIRGADAAHLACAIYAQADVFLTRNFRDFASGDVYKGVKFLLPYTYGGDKLFDVT